METNAIEIRGLTKRYKDFSLENLNLDLPSGCVLGLVGENGAGKSTTIRLIMDALERDAGTVKVLGVDNKSREFLDLKEDIGVVLDETFVPEVITAKQLGKIMAGTYKNWDQSAFDGWVEKLGLPWDKKFKDYSRGMTMKLGIAAALSHHAKLLLLTRPPAGWTPWFGKNCWRSLRTSPPRTATRCCSAAISSAIWSASATMWRSCIRAGW